MKDYINQFYNEGLATTFFIRPVNFINKHVKNENVRKVLIVLIKILYTILALGFGVYMFYKKIPF